MEFLKGNKKGKFRPEVFIVTYCTPEEKNKNSENKNKINYLVLKRKKHWTGWEIPKGGISPKDFGIKKNTVKRELEEETGLGPIKRTIKNHKIKGSFLYDRELKDRDSIGVKYTVFSVETSCKEIDVKDNGDNEHSDYKWLSYNEALKKLTYKNQKDALKKVHNYLRKKDKD